MESALIELSRAECLTLLGDTGFGRLVIAGGPFQAPLIRPVNYRFDESSQSVVFRTLEGSKFHILGRGARACFEIDGFDPETATGWSVIVIGAAERITRPGDIDRLSRLGLPSWLEARPAHWMRLHARTVSGRRLAPPEAH